ncbi:hypothetical protein [Ascidiimonas sp. W6]|uniref:hypothetical protein n=1 Tax=Ascidiimonas meishanensis TaxID=3128903 RepID=UPI0030ECA433
MLRKFLKILFHLLLVILLTAITQIGGILWLISLLILKKESRNYRLKQTFLFLAIYVVFTLFLVPFTAPYAGRQKISNNTMVTYHTVFTVLLNRNYVKPQLHEILQKTALKFQKQYPNIKITYLDASFPFFDGFPLLPHLSHNDGKKIDLAFIYRDVSGVITNQKPSVSGYGVFEEPTKRNFNQTAFCKSKGYFQYDFPKYLTFGTINSKLSLHAKATAHLVQLLANNGNTSKIFIEPHLKTKLRLSSKKIRFHGCQAVRHDDHLHLQL